MPTKYIIVLLHPIWGQGFIMAGEHLPYNTGTVQPPVIPVTSQPLQRSNTYINRGHTE